MAMLDIAAVSNYYCSSHIPQSPTFQVARLFCNLFETGSASEWLLYISEWDAPGGGIPLSNIRVTTKVGQVDIMMFMVTVLLQNILSRADCFDGNFSTRWQ